MSPTSSTSSGGSGCGSTRRAASSTKCPATTRWKAIWPSTRSGPNCLKAAGITTQVCNHTFRGTGITAYLENGGTLEKARQMAAHASTRTTQLYDRREDRVTLDEVVKINIRG